jgi:hypothetical protein
MSASATLGDVLAEPFAPLATVDAVRQMQERFSTQDGSFAALCIFLVAGRSEMTDALKSVGADEAMSVLTGLQGIRESAEHLAALARQAEARSFVAMADAYDIPLDQLFPADEPAEVAA